MATANSKSLFIWFNQLYQRELEDVYRKCLREWGDLGITKDTLTVRLYAIVEDNLLDSDLMEVTDPRIPQFIQKLHASDLFLSIAVLRNNAQAVRDFTETYSPYVMGLCRFYCGTPARAKRLAKLVFGPVLCHKQAEMRPERSLACFNARSTLAAWLMALLVCAVARSRYPLGLPISSPQRTGLPGLLAEPATGAAQAFQESISLLPPRDRLLCLLVSGLGVPLKAAARFFSLKARSARDMITTVEETVREALAAAGTQPEGQERGCADGAPSLEVAPASGLLKVLLPTRKHTLNEVCVSPNRLASYLEGWLSYEEMEDVDRRALFCFECLARLKEVILLSNRTARIIPGVMSSGSHLSRIGNVFKAVFHNDTPS